MGHDTSGYGVWCGGEGHDATGDGRAMGEGATAGAEWDGHMRGDAATPMRVRVRKRFRR